VKVCGLSPEVVVVEVSDLTHSFLLNLVVVALVVEHFWGCQIGVATGARGAMPCPRIAGWHRRRSCPGILSHAPYFHILSKWVMTEDYILIQGARQNNLKGLSLKLPLNELIVVTGVSGAIH
jgi:hypothetical protein